MQKNDISGKIIYLFIVQIILFFFILIRLIFLQIIYKDYYKVLSDQNRINVELLPVKRGYIYDAQGHILADNKLSYKGCLQLTNKKDSDQKIEKIKKLINVDPKNGYENYKNKSLTFKENLSWEEMAKLESHSCDIQGLSTQIVQKRFYPYGKIFSHVLGYTSIANYRDVRNDPSLNNMKIGHGAGLEEMFDKDLRGQLGWNKMEVDAQQRFIRNLEHYPGKEGFELKTTLDLNLQKKAYEILERRNIRSASVVVMNIHTGEIKVLLSYPGYDPNDFTEKITPQTWNTLIKDPDKPLLNKVTQGLYAPGSIFKMVVAACALKNKIITPETTIHCPGYTECGSRRFHCWKWKKGGHGPVNLTQAIAASCDVYFYSIAKKLSVAQIAQIAEKFGFGQISGLSIGDEKKGNIPNQSWVRSWFSQTSDKGEVFNLCIGQGRLLVTPLQLLRMMAAFTNGGYLVEPFLIKETEIKKQKINIDPKHLEWIKNGMVQTVNASYGTAKCLQFFRKDGQMGIGGKTGTTQVRKITLQERQSGAYKNRPYEHRDHALFSGFFPAINPKYAITITVDHGGWGALTAAPIAKELFQGLDKDV